MPNLTGWPKFYDTGPDQIFGGMGSAVTHRRSRDERAAKSRMETIKSLLLLTVLTTPALCARIRKSSWVLMYKFLITFSIFIYWQKIHAGFIEIPSSINASLGSTSHFMCTVQGGLPQWRIDGRRLFQISLVQREISSTTIGRGDIRTSTLSILASVTNNNSAVQCNINNGTAEVMFSPTVELKVQGMWFR